jgi:hypothetical protein
VNTTNIQQFDLNDFVVILLTLRYKQDKRECTHVGTEKHVAVMQEEMA